MQIQCRWHVFDWHNVTKTSTKSRGSFDLSAHESWVVGTLNTSPGSITATTTCTQPRLDVFTALRVLKHRA
jgi:hypothetical protein